MLKTSLTTAQIGRAGELLVQYRLLLLGVDSAPMSTDSGIDLVAYAPATKIPSSIQVKTNLKPKPAGGKGKAHLDWWVSDNSPAQLHALVDLSERRVWMFTADELATQAQQHSKTKYHIYMYTDLSLKPQKKDRAVYVHEFEKYLLQNRAPFLFEP